MMVRSSVCLRRNARVEIYPRRERRREKSGKTRCLVQLVVPFPPERLVQLVVPSLFTTNAVLRLVRAGSPL